MKVKKTVENTSDSEKSAGIYPINKSPNGSDSTAVPHNRPYESNHQEPNPAGSEEYYRNLLEGMAQSVYTIDTEGRLTYCNLPLLQLLDFEEGEIIGKSIYDLIFKESEKKRLQHFLSGLSQENQNPTPFITQKQGNTGKVFDLKIAFSPQITAQGAVTGYIAVATDITAQKQKEKKLLEQNYILEELLSNCSDAVFILQNQLMTFRNGRASEVLNHPQHEVTENDFIDCIQPEFQSAFQSLIQSPVSSLPSENESTFPLRRNPSGILWGEFTKKEARWNGSRATAFFLRDFTEKKRLEESLSSSQGEILQVRQSKCDFLDNISYELRTPLNGITILAQTLTDEAWEQLTTQARTSLSIIHRSSKQISDLINDIIDFSKLRNKDLSLKLKPLNIKTSLEPVYSISKNLVEKKNIQLNFQIRDDLPLIMSDENRLQQILLNLLSNAVKFSHEGKVTVSAEIEGDFLRISVADNGIGIPEQKLKTIFDSFEQFDNHRSRIYGGTGIGLSICKQLVELHGGTIQVKSLENVGSVFSFTLPIAENQEKQSETADIAAGNPLLEIFQESPTPLPIEEKEIREEAPRQPITKKELQKKEQEENQTEETKEEQSPLILIVDDERINLMMLENLLEMNGYRVITSQDPYQALEIIEEEEPDLIVLDLMMPRMNGYEMCKKVRKVYEPGVLPILMLTAKHQKKDLIQGLNSGANDYLSKPFNKEELLARINIHLEVKENKRLKREISRRQKAEQELYSSHYRMAQILDRFNEAIISLNNTKDIIFFNQQAEAILGYKTGEVLGKSISSLLAPTHVDVFFKEFTSFVENKEQNENEELNLNIPILHKDGNSFQANLTISKLHLEKESSFVMTVKKMETSQRANLLIDSMDVAKNESDENKVQVLSDVFDNIIKYLSSGGIDLINNLRSTSGVKSEETTELMTEEQINHEFRKILVDIMNLSLLYWKLTSSKTKTELAEESGIWNVRLEGGETFRTRTMDKYLFLDAIPKKPRWKDVIETAQYVLHNCPNKAPLEKEKLENRLTELLTIRQKMKLISSGIPVLKKNS